MFELQALDPGDPLAVAVFHTRSGAVHATQAACPHREGPLADGILGGTTVICPLHSRRFDVATGAAPSGECGLATYQVRITETGDIMLGTPSTPAAPAGG